MDAYLNHTKTVAAQSQVIDTVTKASVTEVKGLLPVVWRTRVGIRNRLGNSASQQGYKC
jgi:hypothetical protein